MIPDVTGLPLDAAQARLAATGVVIDRVVETHPAAPAAESRKRAGLRIAELTGDLRVIRVRGDGPVELVVTRERYVPQPPAHSTRSELSGPSGP